MGFASSNSVLSLDPRMVTEYGEEHRGNNLIVDPNKVFRLYINGIQKLAHLPEGMIPTQVSEFVNPEYGILSPDRPYIRFLMQSVQLQFNETNAVMKNLSEGFSTYLFGESAPYASCSGILLHTKQDNWSEQFLALYRHVLRASRLAQLSIINNINLSLSIAYQGKILYGSMLSLNKGTNSVNEQGTQFSFQFLIKKLKINWSNLKETGISKDAGVVKDERENSSISETFLIQNKIEAELNDAKNNPLIVS